MSGSTAARSAVTDSLDVVHRGGAARRGRGRRRTERPHRRHTAVSGCSSPPVGGSMESRRAAERVSVIVTGAARGIGAATARRLAEDGASSSGSTSSGDKLEAVIVVAAGEGHRAWPTDLRDLAGHETLVTPRCTRRSIRRDGSPRRRIRRRERSTRSPRTTGTCRSTSTSRPRSS